MTEHIGSNGTLHDDESHSFLILFASETGNAQDTAERIGLEAFKRGYKTRLMAMDAYPLDDLVDEPLVIFVCSTTGNGAEPRNMMTLWKTLLRSDLPSDLLDTMHFGVFGLGDSGYERFNWAAKKLQRRLLSLGALELIPRGDADDQDFYGIESAFGPWLSRLFEALSSTFAGPGHAAETLGPTRPQPRVVMTTLDQPELLLNQFEGLNLRSSRGRIPVTLTHNERMTRADWFQDVHRIEFKADDDISYEPGDVAVLYPENPEDDVTWLLRRMGWEETADVTYSISPYNTATIRQLLAKHLDICAVPRKSFFESVQHFASDEREKEKLNDFCTKEGLDDLHSYTTRPRRTILEVLSEFKSVAIPPEYAVNVFPLLRPREFSIASSVKAHPREVHLCVAIVRYKTIMKVTRKGVCTTWLASLPVGTRIEIGLAEGTMRLPENIKKPIVMVGPGTGVAPFRALEEERVLAGAKDNTLYFGCRSLEADCHYRQEWEEYANKGELTFRLAVSRDQDRKIYVQHLIQEDVSQIFDHLVTNEGHFYICGFVVARPSTTYSARPLIAADDRSSNQMPKAVRKAVISCIAKGGDGWDEAKAEEFVKKMELDGRWGEECWS
ncbi:NAPDH-dependent diflavin reductase [Tulasnella sp. 425]|nr:NAPDH-dependent diflavin reductase [Tulasnella sp. 425]